MRAVISSSLFRHLSFSLPVSTVLLTRVGHSLSKYSSFRTPVGKPHCPFSLSGFRLSILQIHCFGTSHGNSRDDENDDADNSKKNHEKAHRRGIISKTKEKEQEEVEESEIKHQPEKEKSMGDITDSINEDNAV